MSDHLHLTPGYNFPIWYWPDLTYRPWVFPPFYFPLNWYYVTSGGTN